MKKENMNRRAFLKNATKRVLPILGCLILPSSVVWGSDEEQLAPQTCNGSCYGLCTTSCTNGCKSGCKGCQGGCQTTCTTSCGSG